MASTASSSVTPRTVSGAPTGVTATPGNGSALVSWTAPSSNGGASITGYTVTSSPGGQTCSTTGATSCTVSGLTNGTAYTFTATATNSAGTSVASTASNLVTPKVGSGPSIVSISPSSGVLAGGTAITLTGANFTGVSALTLGGVAATSVQANQDGTVLTALTPPATAGGAVDVMVTTSVGSDTRVKAFTYAAAPATPGTPLPAPGDRQVAVSWAQVFTGGDPISYTVTASPGGKTCSADFPGQAFPQASCVVTGLTNGTAYTFVVVANNTQGTATSAPSAAVTPLAVINGACGSANSVTTLIQPTGYFCSAGSPTPVVSNKGVYNWTCSGNGGGTTAQCSAPGDDSPGPAIGATTLNLDTNSNTCKVKSARLITPPTSGPTGGVTMPFGVVNFEMIGCSGSSATVRLTYAKVVEGMDFWKYVVNGYHNGWTKMPSNLVTMKGNTVTFDVVDNGEWDNDPAVGAIADPGGPGYNNLPETPGTPLTVQAVAGAGSATVSWTASASGGAPVQYTVTASPGGRSCTVAAPLTSCVVTGLTAGQSYTFTVVAENAGGASGASSSASTTVISEIQAIPIMSEWAMGLLILLMGGGMVWQMRRNLGARR